MKREAMIAKSLGFACGLSLAQLQAGKTSNLKDKSSNLSVSNKTAIL
ncbi:hypothetical protein [Paraliobacillus zengyii]|nr:hypothetical protein [Paraliobacillus zengyii]